MNSVLNNKFVDASEQPLFLGEDLSLQVYHAPRNPVFLDQFKKQMGFFWRPEWKDLTKDRLDHDKLTHAEKFFFLKNLQYQTMMDSVIGRGIGTLTPFVSSPELEVDMAYWQFCEALHSYSYTYIVKNVYPDADAVFRPVLEDMEIMSRAESVCKNYDDLLVNARNMSDYELREAIYLTLVSTQILEGVRFYLSFAGGFQFAERGLMMGNATILGEILRDENVHVAITQQCLTRLDNDPFEGFVDVARNNRQRVVDMFGQAVEEECSWCDYLFSEGAILGVNAVGMKGFVQWLANTRLRALGHAPISQVKKNPIDGWFSKYVDSSKIQTAPQETELDAYKIGATVNNLSEADYSDVDL